jgi:hypothetical protein
MDGDVFKYNIDFRFDADCDIYIRIHYFATEIFHNQTNTNNSLEYQRQLTYKCGCYSITPVSSINNHQSNKCCCFNTPVIFKKGANIQFHQEDHKIVPSLYPFEVWQSKIQLNYYPIVIECVPVNEQLAQRHSHITLAVLDKSTCHPPPLLPPSNLSTVNGTESTSNNVIITTVFSIKPIKQKQLVDGVLFSLQEIYGIEKKCSSSISGSINGCGDALINESLQIQDKIMKHSKKGESSSNTTTLSSSSSSASSISMTIDPTTAAAAMASKKSMEINEICVQANNYSLADQELEQELKGIECVICMCETRDTLILPCRHLCLCKLCAINLRVQSNNCPICRIPFVALLQVKLVRKTGKKLISKTGSITNATTAASTKMTTTTTTVTPTGGGPCISSAVRMTTCNAANVSIVPSNGNKLTKRKSTNGEYSLYETVTIYEAFNGASAISFTSPLTQAAQPPLSIKTESTTLVQSCDINKKKSSHKNRKKSSKKSNKSKSNEQMNNDDNKKDTNVRLQSTTEMNNAENVALKEMIDDKRSFHNSNNSLVANNSDNIIYSKF